MRVPPVTSAPELIFRFGVAHVAALDATATVFPGTRLRLRYAVSGAG